MRVCIKKLNITKELIFFVGWVLKFDFKSSLIFWKKKIFFSQKMLNLIGKNLTFFAYHNNLQPVDRLKIFVFCQYYFIFCLFWVLSWNSLSYFPFFIWFLSHHSSMSNFQVHLNFFGANWFGFVENLPVVELNHRLNKNNDAFLRTTCISFFLD